jgi:hypothetical protein
MIAKKTVDLEKLAARIARRLCTDSDGRRAVRLAMMHKVQGEPGEREGGGRCGGVIRDIIIEELLAQAERVGLKVE